MVSDVLRSAERKTTVQQHAKRRKLITESLEIGKSCTNTHSMFIIAHVLLLDHLRFVIMSHEEISVDRY